MIESLEELLGEEISVVEFSDDVDSVLTLLGEVFVVFDHQLLEVVQILRLLRVYPEFRLYDEVMCNFRSRRRELLYGWLIDLFQLFLYLIIEFAVDGLSGYGFLTELFARG